MSQQESMELKYLKSLARQYPNIAAASTEIMEAINDAGDKIKKLSDKLGFHVYGSGY